MGTGTGRDGRTFSILEMDNVNAGMVGSVVADVAEVGASAGGGGEGRRGGWERERKDTEQHLA